MYYSAGTYESFAHPEKPQGVKLYTAPLLSSRCEYARHDPILLTQAIMEVFNQQARRRNRRSGYR